MTLISPEIYVENLEDESYEELIKERDRIIREIRFFEKNRKKIVNTVPYMISPSPETFYYWNLEALACVCKLMSRRVEHMDYEEHSKIIHNKVCEKLCKKL